MPIYTTRLTVLLLSVFSLSISLHVWFTASSDFTLQALLFIAAVGVELAKIVLIKMTYFFQKEKNPLCYLAGFLSICILLISILTMTSFFDKIVTDHGNRSNNAQLKNDISKRELQRKMETEEAILRATDKYVQQGNVTQKGIERLLTLRNDKSGAMFEMSAMSHDTGVLEYSPSLAAMSEMSYIRYIIIIIFCAILDITLATLLIAMSYYDDKTRNDLDVEVDIQVDDKDDDSSKNSQIKKCNTKFDIHDYIKNVPCNHPIKVTQLMHDSKLRYQDVKKILDQKMGNEIVRSKNRYIKAPMTPTITLRASV